MVERPQLGCDRLTSRVELRREPRFPALAARLSPSRDAEAEQHHDRERPDDQSGTEPSHHVAPTGIARAATQQRRLAGEKAVEIRRQQLQRVVALGRLLRQALQDDALERGRHHRPASGERQRVVVHEAEQHVGWCLAVEGFSPADELVEDHAEREHVGSMVDQRGAAARLLGRHVAGRAHDLAGQRDLVALLLARDAEVEHADAWICAFAGIGHQQVRRLEVAVHDTALVRVVHRGANALEQTHARLEAELASAAVLEQMVAFHVLESEERAAVPGDAGVEHAGDSGMLEVGQDLPLALEALLHLLPLRVALVEHLERHQLVRRAAHPQRQVHAAHATLPDLLDDLVGADAPAGREHGVEAVELEAVDEIARDPAQRQVEHRAVLGGAQIFVEAAAHPRIVPLDLGEEARELLALELERLVEQGLEPLPFLTAGHAGIVAETRRSGTRDRPGPDTLGPPR